MERVELLAVEESFLLGRNAVSMLILHPNFSVPESGWQKRTEIVTVVRPDGQKSEATAEFSMTHLNISDPEACMDRRWRVVVGLIDRSKEEVPTGSRVLVAPAVRDALLTSPK